MKESTIKNSMFRGTKLTLRDGRTGIFLELGKRYPDGKMYTKIELPDKDGVYSHEEIIFPAQIVE